MPKIARISLLLLCAWVLLNVGPTLILSLSKGASFSDAVIRMCSGFVWYWEVVHRSWTLSGIYPYILLVRAFILLFALKLWLRKPNLLRASVLVAVGPMVAPTWYFYFWAPLLLFCSVLTVLGGVLIQGWWDNRNRPAPGPSAPMPTWHH